MALLFHMRAQKLVYVYIYIYILSYMELEVLSQSLHGSRMARRYMLAIAGCTFSE